jgi:hypothetical protein
MPVRRSSWSPAIAPDLVRVRDRTEQAIAVRTKRIAGAREFERLASGWSRYAYQEAAEGFARLWTDMKTEGLSREELRPLTRGKELSQAFAAWDSFDHKGRLPARLSPFRLGRGPLLPAPHRSLCWCPSGT